MHCPCVRSLLALVLQLYAGQADLSWCQVHVQLMFYVCFKRMKSLILPLKTINLWSKKIRLKHTYVQLYIPFTNFALDSSAYHISHGTSRSRWEILLKLTFNYNSDCLGLSQTDHRHHLSPKANAQKEQQLPVMQICRNGKPVQVRLSLVGQTGKRFVNNILLSFFRRVFHFSLTTRLAIICRNLWSVILDD